MKSRSFTATTNHVPDEQAYDIIIVVSITSSPRQRPVQSRSLGVFLVRFRRACGSNRLTKLFFGDNDGF